MISVNGGSGYQFGHSGTVFTTPHDDTLILNKQILGVLPQPFSADQWHFAAVAGQQVHFDRVNVSGPGVEFDLLGPDNWVGFTQLTNRSDLITLPVSGTYTLFARGTGGAGGRTYTCALIETVQTNIVLGMPFSGTFVASGQAQLFRFDVTQNKPLLVSLVNNATGNRTELYLSFGTPPTRGTFNQSSTATSTANQSILRTDSYPGSYYALVYADTITTPGDYTLEVISADMLVGSITPATLGNSIPGTVTIDGAGFTPGTTVALVNGGTTYPATEVGVVSSSRILADFDFMTMSAGNYTLRVTAGTNSSELPFTLTSGGQPGLSTKIIVPRTVGYHNVATIWVEYANTGQVAVLAPILEVSAQQNGRRAAMITLDYSRFVQGFWTSAMPEGFANSVQFLAGGKTPGILQPGESNRVAVYYVGWQPPWDFGYSTIYWNLSVISADNTNEINWVSLKEFMRPSTFTAEQWEPVFGNVIDRIGLNWGDYVRALDNNARYLAKLGETVTDIRDLLSFEVMQASGLGVTRTLVSALDAQVQAPGLPITFTRSFSTDIPSQFRMGRFGRGWSDNWDYSLTNASDGTVTVLGPSGSRRVFQPDSRNSAHYFSQPGDYAALRSLGSGIFTLQEASGTIYTFSGGKLQSLQDTHTNTIICAYSGDQLTRLTHSAGPWLQLTYTGARVASMLDSVGRQTTFAYDGGGEHLMSAVDYRGPATTYQYQSLGLATAHALTDVGNPDGTHQLYTYDAQGRLASKSGCCGSSGLTVYGYDSVGKITATDCLTNTSTYWFDYRGTLVKSQDPLGNITLRSYGANGQLLKVTDPAGRIRAYDYDDHGNLATDTDALGYTTRYSYDGPFNRLSNVLDANGNPTHYNYEPDGDLSSIVNAASLAEGWTYDAWGNRRSWQNCRGQTITYTNDSLGRVIARGYPDGTLHTFSYDARGNLTNYTDATGSTAQQFDAQDRLIQITYPAGYWLRYTYDTAGRRASMTDHLGHRSDYHYGADGRLQLLTDETGFEIVRYEYDQAGRMSLKTLGNGVYTTYTYDAAGQLLNLFNYQTNGAVLSHFQYSYDNRGCRVTMTTTYGTDDPRTSLAGLWRYDYDDTGQLIGWTAPWGRRVDYSYDGLGNRLLVRDNGTNIAYSVNNLNQYTQVGGTVYQYDADGNMTNKVTAGGTTGFGWTSDNKMARVIRTEGMWENYYGANGSRVGVNSDSAVKDYVVDITGFGNIVGEYMHGTTQPYAVFGYGASLVSRRTELHKDYYSFDALGSTSELLGESGAVLNSYVYMPFGEIVAENGETNKSFQFIGEEGVMAEDNQLGFMRARYYDPQIGRFLSTDPLSLAGGDVNLFRYVLNDPVNQTDPEGLVVVVDYKECEKRYKEAKKKCASWDWYCQWLAMQILNKCLLCLPGDPNCPAKNYDPNNPTCLMQSGGNGSKIAFARATGASDDCDNGGGGPSHPSSPNDPNELLGPGGYGAQNFVAVGSLLPYRINFENATNATAPAQFVTIQNVLDSSLDLTAFELSSIGFGDRFFAIPTGSQHYEHTETITMSGYRFQVQIEAGLNLATRTVYANFRSINPTNGLPPTVDIGFLPPEDGTGRGLGHLAYVIRSKSGLPTGTEIRNVASIVFDQQPAIDTDWKDPHNPGLGIDTNKQALVTIDADAPSSSVNPLPGSAASTFFTVCWSGTDTGSGIANYDVYVQTNSGPWTLWLSKFVANCALFEGANGNTYSFYSVGRDGSGNVQPTPSAAQTSVTVTVPLALPPQPDLVVDELTAMVVTNTATGGDASAYPLRYSLLDAPTGSVIDGSGIIRWTPGQAQSPSTNVITTLVSDSAVPAHSASNRFTVVVREVNVAPVLAVIPTQTVSPSARLVVTNQASESNIHSTLSYRLIVPPAGAAIDSNGIITWTPSESQSSSTNAITTVVENSNPFDTVRPHLSATNTFTVIVTASAGPLSVISQETGPNSVTIGFNRAFDASVINLYDSAAGLLGPADVKVAGSVSGRIAGSLMMKSQNRSFVFIKSGGVFNPDSYTITLRSATNGFKDLQGNVLDGNGDGVTGDDYQGRFTVGTYLARNIQVPSFARGPGQEVNLPPTNSGIPVVLKEASNVVSASFIIHYDTNQLRVVGVVANKELPTGWTMTNHLETAGQVSISMGGDIPLSSGVVTLARVLAQVPWCATYGETDGVTVESVQINKIEMSEFGSISLHVVAYLGDVNRNRSYDADDATLISEVALDSNRGFAMYPLIDPVLLGDLNANDVIGMNDASLAARLAVDLPVTWVPNLPQVRLVVGKDQDEVTISWPMCAGSYVLESSAALGVGANWQEVPNMPAISGDRYIAVVKAGSQTSFYRLKLVIGD